MESHLGNLLSRNQTTYASPTYYVLNYQLTHNKAVDGNRDGDIFKRINHSINQWRLILILVSCYHSEQEYNVKWWMVVLPYVSIITDVHIYPRTLYGLFIIDISSVVLISYLEYRNGKLTFFGSFDKQDQFINTSKAFYNISYYEGPQAKNETMIKISFPRFVWYFNDLWEFNLVSRYRECLSFRNHMRRNQSTFVKLRFMDTNLRKPIRQFVIVIINKYYWWMRSDNYYGPHPTHENVTHFMKIAVRSNLECGKICMEIYECVSFSVQNRRQCLIYNHAGGEYLSLRS